MMNPGDAAAAIPTATATAPVAAPPAAPPASPAVDDPSLSLFAKVAAERRTRAANAQWFTEVPFGTGTIRIYSTMPANWAYLAANAANDAHSAFAAIAEAIIDEDKPRFEQVRRLPPNNAEGIDGEFLVGFLDALGSFYGGTPTPAS